MARRQTLVQLTDEVLVLLDARRAREGGSRSEHIRKALDAYLAADRASTIDRRIVDAYARVPQDDGDDLHAFARAAGRELIEAEPW
jgi:metal-responsive CopG/Arc/MetJ family transcriptional regulator